MKKSKVNKLRAGIYKLHWKNEGVSLAAVGVTRDGCRWMAPINWVEVGATHRDAWKAVKRAEQVVFWDRERHKIQVP